jgi:hypothetical protein
VMEIYKKTGGSEAGMDAKIVELMGREKESENLARVLFLPGRKTAAKTGG